MKNKIAISVNDICLSYKIKASLFRSEYRPALKKVSFDVQKGETLGIIGRNGSGKSTLLRVLAGIYQPDSGTISTNVSSIALMTLQLGFDSVLNGRDNAVFGGMLMGFNRSEVESRIEIIHEFSGLGDSFFAPVRTYSSGMASRLSFSVALNMSPDVMLLDEVLAVGDEEFRNKAHSAMTAKITSDQTTILVSHSAEDIERLCDRAILLDAGEFVLSGSPREVIDAYRSLIVSENQW